MSRARQRLDIAAVRERARASTRAARTDLAAASAVLPACAAEIQ
jgi:hypothetical protein